MSGTFRARLASGDIFVITIKDTVKDGYGLVYSISNSISKFANTSLIECGTLVSWIYGADPILGKIQETLMNSDTFEHFRYILRSNGVFF